MRKTYGRFYLVFQRTTLPHFQGISKHLFTLASARNQTLPLVC